jgi:hypothetical protein
VSSYQIVDVTPKPRLALRVTDAATERPMRMLVYSGELVLARQQTGLMAYSGLLPREPTGFFVPDGEALEPNAEPPTMHAEAYLCGIVTAGQVQKDVGYGVAEASATYAPDPRGGPARWLYLSFTATTLVALRIGYRITALTALG